MADHNINEKIRKPRRARGTPFHFERNIYALVTIAVGGLCWYLFERTTWSSKLRQDIENGKYDYSPAVQQHILSMRLGLQDPVLQQTVQKLRDRELERSEAQHETEQKHQPWFAKFFEPKTGQ